MANFISIDKSRYTELKSLYAKAVTDKADSFKFMGESILTSYAKYVLEYLKPKFEKVK